MQHTHNLSVAVIFKYSILDRRKMFLNMNDAFGLTCMKPGMLLVDKKYTRAVE